MEVPDHEKTNALLNLIGEQDNDEPIDKIYLYSKDLNEPKYEFLIRKREDVGIRHLIDPKSFKQFSNTVNDVCNNFNDYNPNTSREILLVFSVLIADIMANKIFQPIIKKLFLRSSNLNVSFVFITKSYFLSQKKLD